ncbi:NAD(P)H-dependent oxidoreductase [Candidatus Saccharibacteria bacterium]|nr:MAG: NAD(P)H-dependent oxidoreductase [Candidatus Saccharibacteria bacterium]
MKLGIIVGSVRQGRVSGNMATWVANAAKAYEGVDVEVIDLLDYKLPMFDEAVSPQYNPDRKPEGEAKKWLDVLARQEAYVIVTPEYNRSISGALKNALDYVAYEMAKKPVALASHGSTEGAQAVAQLRGILAGVLAVATPVFVGLPYMDAQNMKEDGTFEDAGSYRAGQLKAALDDVVWYGNALAAARK